MPSPVPSRPAAMAQDASVRHVLLLGAGFSRNWGGWLASEAFEYLLGRSELDEALRQLLWKHRRAEGFEGALGELQEQYFRSLFPSSWVPGDRPWPGITER